MEELVIRSPAKVNLFLEILGPRGDGYHEIETVLATVSLADEVRLRNSTNGISVSCPSGGAPENEANLAWRAADLLRKELGLVRGVHVELRKRIPECSGLGGGSSNAGSTLLGLNRLWNLGLSRDELAGVGAKVGMDVPFFLQVAESEDESGAPVIQGAGLATGRGEKVKRIKHRVDIWVVLALPGFGISTAWAYSRLRFGLTAGREDSRIVSKALETGDVERLGAGLFNRLEEVALETYPELARLKMQLKNAGAAAALLSGSGSAVFGLVSSREEACRISRTLESEWPGGGAMRTEVARLL